MDVKNFIQKNHTTIILSLIIILHILILLQTVFWPAAEFRILPYLTAKGLVPYKDIIDQHFPGIFLFPINLFTIGLANPLGLRLMQIFIVASTHVAIYLITRKLKNSGRYSFYSNIMYVFAQTLFEGYVLWIDSFISPLVLISYLLLISETKGAGFRLTFLSGIFLSLALLFKQLIVLVFGLVFIVLLLFRANKKRIFMFALGFVLPVIFMLIYFSSRQLMNDFFYWTIIFNSKVYPEYAFRLPTLKEILILFVITAPFIVLTVREYIKEKRRNILFLSAYALPLLIFIYGRYDFVHLQPFIPFACIFISIGPFLNRPRFHYAFAYLLIFILLCTLQLSKLGKYTTFIENIDARVKSSLSEEDVFFAPYNAMELQSILRNRATKAFRDGIVGEGVIEKCAAYVAREYGDARKAIELLRVAGEIAERAKDKKISTQHIDDAEEKLEKDKIFDIIKTQPKQFQAVLFSIFSLRNKSAAIYGSEMYSLYKELCFRIGLRPLTQRRVSSIIGEFELMGLISTRTISKGRYGRTREIMASISPSTIPLAKKILEEELELR